MLYSGKQQIMLGKPGGPWVVWATHRRHKQKRCGSYREHLHSSPPHATCSPLTTRANPAHGPRAKAGHTCLQSPAKSSVRLSSPLPSLSLSLSLSLSFSLSLSLSLSYSYSTFGDSFWGKKKCTSQQHCCKLIKNHLDLQKEKFDSAAKIWGQAPRVRVSQTYVQPSPAQSALRAQS